LLPWALRSSAEEEVRQRAVFARAVRCGVKLFDAADAPTCACGIPAGEERRGKGSKETQHADW
jgi:ribosomal protein L37E